MDADDIPSVSSDADVTSDSGRTDGASSSGRGVSSTPRKEPSGVDDSGAHGLADDPNADEESRLRDAAEVVVESLVLGSVLGTVGSASTNAASAVMSTNMSNHDLQSISNTIDAYLGKNRYASIYTT